MKELKFLGKPVPDFTAENEGCSKCHHADGCSCAYEHLEGALKEAAKMLLVKDITTFRHLIDKEWAQGEHFSVVIGRLLRETLGEKTGGRK